MYALLGNGIRSRIVRGGPSVLPLPYSSGPHHVGNALVVLSQEIRVYRVYKTSIDPYYVINAGGWVKNNVWFSNAMLVEAIQYLSGQVTNYSL